MRLVCRISGHRADAAQSYNDGFFFTRCRRCRAILIRTGRRAWAPAPRGHIVVWKAGRHSHSLAPDYEGVLPVLVAGEQLPATRSGFLSWSRDMVASARKLRAADPVAREKEPEPQPGFIFAALLLGVGIRLLGGLGVRV